MPITDYKLLAFTDNVQELPNRPAIGATALKAWFDAAPDELRVKYNALIDYLNTSYPTEDDITTNRKLSATGDFTGMLNGYPIVAAEPGLSSTVAGHTAQLADMAISPEQFSGTDFNKVQSAINAAVTSKKSVRLTKIYNITGSGTLKLNKSTQFDRRILYIFGEGGGIRKDDGGIIFSTDYNDYHGDFSFSSCRFESVEGAGTVVFDGNRLIRVNCRDNEYFNVDTIVKNSNPPSPYVALQSWKFIHEHVVGGKGKVIEGYNVHDFVFQSSLIEDRKVAADGIFIYGGARISIEDNVIESINAGASISVRGAKTFSIKKNYLEANYHCIDIRSISNTDVFDGIIENNVLWNQLDSTNPFIMLDRCGGIQINNNTSNDSAPLINNSSNYLASGNSMRSISMVGNLTQYGSSVDGITGEKYFIPFEFNRIDVKMLQIDSSRKIRHIGAVNGINPTKYTDLILGEVVSGKLVLTTTAVNGVGNYAGVIETEYVIGTTGSTAYINTKREIMGTTSTKTAITPGTMIYDAIYGWKIPISFLVTDVNNICDIWVDFIPFSSVNTSADVLNNVENWHLNINQL